jgi:hypothetical protein
MLRSVRCAVAPCGRPATRNTTSYAMRERTILVSPAALALSQAVMTSRLARSRCFRRSFRDSPQDCHHHRARLTGTRAGPELVERNTNQELFSLECYDARVVSVDPNPGDVAGWNDRIAYTETDEKRSRPDEASFALIESAPTPAGARRRSEEQMSHGDIRDLMLNIRRQDHTWLV